MKLIGELQELRRYLDDREWEYDVLIEHGENRTGIADTIGFDLGNDYIRVRSYEWQDGSTYVSWNPKYFGDLEDFVNIDELIDRKLETW